MKALNPLLNGFVAAFVALFFACAPVFAQTSDGQMQTGDLDALFDRLKSATATEAEGIEAEIWLAWSKSGSDAMDLLLERGRSAMSAGDPDLAVQHLTALIDHAPGFAEGWNARATAYYQLGAFGPAVSDIARTLTLNPRHFGALSGLGSIFEELGTPLKARQAYEAALAINPYAAGVSDAIARISRETEGQDL
jgi:Flp pilus assembly protein TadD